VDTAALVPIATDFSVAHQEPQTNATEISVASVAYNKITNATEITGAQVEHGNDERRNYKGRTRLRPEAARRAEQVAEAIQVWADQNRIPWYAVGIDQARILELLGRPATFAERGKVWRALRYAQRIGLLAILEPGRPRADRDGEGVPGLYAIFGTEAGEANLLSDAQIADLQRVASAEIVGSYRTRLRVQRYQKKLENFDRQNPNVRKRRRKRRPTKAEPDEDD
jgi:hypothetical protein